MKNTQMLMPFGERRERPSYPDHLKGPHIRRLRDFVAIRDGKKCVWCGTTRRLVLGHKTYVNTPNETIDDVHQLCWDCNQDEYIRGMAQNHYRDLCVAAMEPEPEKPAWVLKIYVEPDDPGETVVTVADWRMAS